MSFSLVVLKILVPAVAKTLLDAAGIESTLTKKVLEQGFDAAANGIPDLGNRRKLEQKIGQIAGELQTQIRPLFEQEARNLGANSREAVLLGVAETLFKGGLSTDALVGMNLDAQQLYQHLLKANPKISRDFSWDEKALYEQSLLVASQILIEAAPQLEEFSLSVAATNLQRLDEVLNYLKTQREQALQAADEFVERYCKTVISELDRLEVFGLPRMDRLTHKQSLSMAYITLSVSGDDEPDCSPVTLIDDAGMGREAVNRSRRVDEVICNCRRLVIRGGAGAGKSTLLQWLAVRAASQNFPEKLQHWNYKIPFFIRLRSLVDKGFPTPEDFPKLIAPNFAANMPQGWAHKYLDRGHALVLIDGVDELPSQQRQAFFEALEDLVRDFSDATYIVTSRPSGLKSLQGEEWQEWEDWVKNEGFKNLTLEPMSSTNVEEFITRWHRALNSNSSSNTQQDDPRQIADNLKRQLRQRAELRRLASTPLLCAMICALHRERVETLPSSRLLLYRDCIDMLLNRRDEGRKIPLDETYPIGLNEDQKMAFIQSLAFWLMENNRSDIEVDRVDAHFDRRLRLMSLPQGVTGEQIRSLFVDRSGLLREPVMGQIDFAHRTFQEYLAAKAALEKDSLDLLLQRATDDQWREAIIAAAGLGRPREKEKLLKALIEKGNTDPDKKHYLHLLAVACLETVVEVDPIIRQEVLDNAKILLPPKDEDEIAMVARAGDAIVPLLEYEPQFSAEEACNCIRALTHIGSSIAMQKLIAYAEAKFDSQRDKFLIAQALGGGWDYFDRDAYIRNVLSLVKKLDLNGTQVQDITPLTALTQLQSLSLIETQVQDITPLTALTQLQLLYLRGTQVQDITLLTALTQLQSLGLIQTQVQDITPLSALTQLQTLDLTGTQVQDITPLSALTQLQMLDLSGTQVQDITPLSALTQLQMLRLIETQVQDITPLSALTQLQMLDLSGKVQDITPLSALTQLQRLGLSETQVQDITSLSALTQLESLYLSGKIQDITPLSALTQLQSLYLIGTQVQDITPLSALTQLQTLDLSGTQVQDITSLSALTQLQTLDLSGTQVQDITPLSALTQLQMLDLSGTQVQDITPLKELTNLKIVIDDSN